METLARNLDAVDVDTLLMEAKRTNAPHAYVTYARLKAHAMMARETGDIPLALSVEALCDMAYKGIPAEWTW